MDMWLDGLWLLLASSSRAVPVLPLPHTSVVYGLKSVFCLPYVFPHFFFFSCLPSPVLSLSVPISHTCLEVLRPEFKKVLWLQTQVLQLCCTPLPENIAKCDEKHWNAAAFWVGGSSQPVTTVCCIAGVGQEEFWLRCLLWLHVGVFCPRRAWLLQYWSSATPAEVSGNCGCSASLENQAQKSHSKGFWGVWINVAWHMAIYPAESYNYESIYTERMTSGNAFQSAEWEPTPKPAVPLYWSHRALFWVGDAGRWQNYVLVIGIVLSAHYWGVRL